MKRAGERVLKYLLTRQKRAARLEAFGRALDAGILEREPIGGDERSGLVWRLDPDASQMLCGDVDRDRKVITTLLARTSKDELASPEEELNEPWAQDKGRKERPEASATRSRSAKSSSCPATASNAASKTKTGLRDQVLSLVAECAAAPKVTEVTTALLLARAVDRSGHSLNQVLAVLKSRTAILALTIPVRDFERNLGRLLEDGLVMPFYVSLDPIADGPTLTGRYQPLADSRRRKSFSCLGSASLEKYDDDELRSMISRRVLTGSKPLVICYETSRPLPARLVALADIMIEGSGIDGSMIADVLAVCFGIPASRSVLLMTDLDFDPEHLGIDDLAIAMRPGRSLDEIVSILSTLDAENTAHAEAADEDGQGGAHARMRRKFGRIGSQDLGQKSGSYDVIEPARTETAPKSAEPVEPQSAGTAFADRNHLFVENLAGYGEAKKWALDLKFDIEAFRNEDVAWADLSTRLLLSGPPGTGKTTFARALGNTLQIPLVATSVARWLERSLLGDVLTAMRATFEHAQSNAPCILFVDEVDNIGSRGNAYGDFRDDYWASLINRLLELLDGAAKTDGVIVVGATNRPEKIDRALLRSGRLEKHIVIQPPDTEALVGIIAHHLGGDLDAVMSGVGTQTGLERAKDNVHRRSNQSDVSAALKPLARAAAGMTGADIERLLREARQKARREKRALSYDDIQNALTSGQMKMPPDLRWRIAVHESGHALAWTVFDIGIVQSVTIGHSSGGLVQTEIREGLIKDEQWINQLIAIALAGQAAEKMIFGSSTAGSGGHEQSDLALATSLATDAETSLGFGKAHPLLYRPVEQNPSALSVERDLARHVYDRLLAAEKMALDILSSHREALLALATRLAEVTVLEGDDVRATLAEKISASR